MNLLGAPWWRDEPLTPPEMRLLEALAEAHAASARRMPASSQAMVTAAAGSGDFGKALAAGVMTLGGAHAPLEATCFLLAQPQPVVRASALLRAGFRVPGWGNSFHWGEPDALWGGVEDALREDFPELAAKIWSVTATLHRAGKILFPNPSAFTAAAAIAVGLPPQGAPYLFIAARLESWSRQILEYLQPPII